jgi:hypothetical protein
MVTVWLSLSMILACRPCRWRGLAWWLMRTRSPMSAGTYARGDVQIDDEEPPIAQGRPVLGRRRHALRERPVLIRPLFSAPPDRVSLDHAQCHLLGQVEPAPRRSTVVSTHDARPEASGPAPSALGRRPIGERSWIERVERPPKPLQITAARVAP